MTGPIPSLTSLLPNSRLIACARRWAVLCRMISRPSLESGVMISTAAPSVSSVLKSTAAPLILPANAFLRRPLLIEAATSSNVLPSAYSRTEPSGKEIDTATFCSSLNFVIHCRERTTKKARPGKGRALYTRGSTLIRLPTASCSILHSVRNNPYSAFGNGNEPAFLNS
ncbi:hypothetical protein D3C77_445010 [compost metagenome]